MAHLTDGIRQILKDSGSRVEDSTVHIENNDGGISHMLTS